VGKRDQVRSVVSSGCAIQLKDVSKVYPIYRNAFQETTSFFRMRRSAKTSAAVHTALDGVTFSVDRGERVAIIGRNGAGKSTLLKLITGVLQQTSGFVSVNGRVSALFDLGVGFHEEFTGRENARAALAYNDLDVDARARALQDVIDYCELGEYLDQPVRTYSAGMKARLFFAVATAIEPDILVVDEVLGTGDAYFGVRSQDRIERLTASGCTMLLVSHNLGQAKQLCARAIWLEKGAIKAIGPIDDVVSQYRAFISTLEDTASARRGAEATANRWLEKLLTRIIFVSESPSLGETDRIRQFPVEVSLCSQSGEETQRLIAVTGEALSLQVRLQTSAPVNETVRVALFIFTSDGRLVDRCLSPIRRLRCEAGIVIRVSVLFEPVVLGPGQYLVRAALFEAGDSLAGEKLNTACVAVGERSMVLDMVCADASETALMIHPAEWSLVGGPA
jgi:lipopolysaccharide transport system ATP-binding protein